MPAGREPAAGGVRGPCLGPRLRMIASLRGKLRRKLDDRVVVEAAGVGYEVFVPPVTQQELVHVKAADGDAADEVIDAITAA